MTDAARPVGRRSSIDRQLSVRIVTAMAPGDFTGTAFIDRPAAIDRRPVGTTTIPIAMGLPLSAAAASGK